MSKRLPFLARGHLARGVSLALVCAILLTGAAWSGVTLGSGWLGQFGQDRWSPQEQAVLASLRQAPSAAIDPSNRLATSAAAAQFGRQLFNDPRLSRNGAVSCATCHHPQAQFEDGRPRGIGLAQGPRRTMPLMDLAHNAWFFWDGRKDSLWSQALGPLEDAREHGGNRLHYVRLLRQHHQPAYEALFGPLPDLQGLPQAASPLGSEAERTAWQALTPGTRQAISRAFANMGKALAAYQHPLSHGPSPVDRYIESVLAADTGKRGGLSALDADQKAGLRLFIGKAQCVTCHGGPLLTDGHFHNTGVPPLDTGKPDRGRAAAIAVLQADEFNCLGPFSDARPEQCEELRYLATDDPQMEGAFKTPSLRNVALRPPYMHAGQFSTLGDVLRHYVQAPDSAIGHSELQQLKPHRLSADELRQLERLLAAFSSPVLDPSRLTPPHAPEPPPPSP